MLAALFAAGSTAWSLPLLSSQMSDGLQLHCCTCKVVDVSSHFLCCKAAAPNAKCMLLASQPSTDRLQAICSSVSALRPPCKTHTTKSGIDASTNALAQQRAGKFAVLQCIASATWMRTRVLSLGPGHPLLHPLHCLSAQNVEAKLDGSKPKQLASCKPFSSACQSRCICQKRHAQLLR